MTSKPPSDPPEPVPAPTYEHAPPTVNMAALRRQKGEPAMVPGTMPGLGALTRPEPPIEAPKVEVAPSLVMEAARRRDEPAPQRPAPPGTEVMAAVQRRREEERREGSEWPLRIALVVIALFIAALLAALAYGVTHLASAPEIERARAEWS